MAFWCSARGLKCGGAIVSAEDGSVKVWNTSAWGKPAQTLTAGPETIWCVAFSPDGRPAAGGGDDGNVFLWDLSTGQVITKFKAPGNGMVLAVGFWRELDALVAVTPPLLHIWQALPSTPP